MSCWDILAIMPTDNTADIKTAFSSKSKECHPEDDPEGFQKLREAYKQALQLATISEDDTFHQTQLDDITSQDSDTAGIGPPVVSPNPTLHFDLAEDINYLEGLLNQFSHASKEIVVKSQRNAERIRQPRADRNATLHLSFKLVILVVLLLLSCVFFAFFRIH